MSITQPLPVQPMRVQPPLAQQTIPSGAPVNITIATAMPQQSNGVPVLPMSLASKESVKLLSGSRSQPSCKSSHEPLWQQIAASCIGFMLAIISTLGVATLVLRHHVGKPIFGGLRASLLHAREGLRFFAQISEISKQDQVLDSMREISGAMKDFKIMKGKKNVRKLHENVVELNQVFEAFRKNGVLDPTMADSVSDMGHNAKEMVHRFQNSWAAWLMGMGRRK